MSAMTFEEMDEMWHRIREDHARATAGMTREEKIAFYQERSRDLAERLGLKVVTETSPVKRRTSGE